MSKLIYLELERGASSIVGKKQLIRDNSCRNKLSQLNT
jgi:hypothetical protein